MNVLNLRVKYKYNFSFVVSDINDKFERSRKIIWEQLVNIRRN